MSGYAETVAAWAAHLRAGGQQPWSEFAEKDRVAPGSALPPDVPRSHPEAIPSAAQLALLWRLSPGVTDVDQFADLIFATPAPGRGLIDIPLTWHRESPWGTPAHDPADLPANELLRQALGVLSALLANAQPPAPRPQRTRLPLPWRPRFQLHGSPVARTCVGAELRARRLHETDLKPVHLVLAQPLDVMMMEHWVRRVRGGAIVKWHSLWRQAQRRGRLPDGLDIAAIAHRLRASGQQVHVVAAPTPTAIQTAAVASFGLSPRLSPTPISAAATDVHRRLNRLLTLTFGMERCQQLQPLLAEMLDYRDERALGVPVQAVEWAHAQAESQIEQLLTGDYPVHGDLSSLRPRDVAETDRAMTPQRALPAALAATSRAWQHRKETPWPNA